MHQKRDKQTDGQMNIPEAICPSNFFEVGGIKMAKNSSCPTDNLTRCFMAIALNSGTLMSLFTTGGISRITWGLLFSDNSGYLHCNI